MELRLEGPALGIFVELSQERVVVGDFLDERRLEFLGETAREAGLPYSDRPLDCDVPRLAHGDPSLPATRLPSWPHGADPKEAG